jgi:hypothetical protein
MKSRIERIERVSKALEVANEASNSRTYTIWWRGNRESFPVIVIPIEYVIYRIENSRTIREQIQYLEQNPHLDTDTFVDPETTAAQEAQHRILHEMLQKTGKKFIEDIEERGQDQPAIITHIGVLVNGNRRTCALKEINEQYIDCIVLPKDATLTEIYDLEQELQISQDFKEPYHWVNEVLNIYHGIKDHGKNEDLLARHLRRDVAYVRQRTRMKEFIDKFLLWKKIAGKYNYSKLDDAEQIFIELEKIPRMRKYSSEKKEQLILAIFNWIEERPTSGRVYGHVSRLIANFDQVFERFLQKSGNDFNPEEAIGSSEESDNLESEEKEEDTSDSDQIIEDILDIADEDNNEKEVNLFNDSEQAESVSEELLDILDDVEAENKDIKSSERAYTSVSKALRELKSVKIDNQSRKLNHAKNKLEEIIKVSTKIISTIESTINS